MARSSKPIRIPFVAEVKEALRGLTSLDDAMGDTGKSATEAQKTLGEVGDGAEESAREAEAAFRKLGLRSVETAEKQKQSLLDAYNTLEKSGSQTTEQLRRAWEQTQFKISRINRDISRNTESEFSQMVRRVRGRMTDLSAGILRGIGRIAIGGGAAFGAAAAAGAVVGRNIQISAEFADAMTKLARQTNISVETLSAFGFAAEQSGVASATFARSINNLRKNAADGKDVFEELGISVRDAGGEFLDLEELIPNIVDRLGRIEDPIEAARAAAEIFGEKAGPEMASMIALGSQGLKDYIAAAHRFGIVVDQESGEAAERFNDRLDDLTRRFQGLRLQASAPFFDKFAQAFDQIGAVIDANQKRIIEFAGMLSGRVLSAETAAEDLRTEAEAELTAAVERAERILASERAAAQRAQERVAALAAAQDECLESELPAELWD